MRKSTEELLVGYDTEWALFGLFFAFGNQLQTAGDHFYEEITCKQFFMIMCLRLFQEEPPTISQVSEVMKSTHQNVKQLAIKLEQLGYVHMEEDPKDRRKIRIRLDESTERLRQKYKVQELEFFKGLYEGIPKEDIVTTYKTLLKLEQNLDNIGGKR